VQLHSVVTVVMPPECTLHALQHSAISLTHDTCAWQPAYYRICTVDWQFDWINIEFKGFEQRPHSKGQNDDHVYES
jgi:hypothetical protein